MTLPNLYLVGGMYLSPQSDPLDKEYTNYTKSWYVVYVSFGSYAIPDWLPWFLTLFEALELSKASFVIAKIYRHPILAIMFLEHLIRLYLKDGFLNVHCWEVAG